VAYLDGSKVLTTGSALVFDGTNLGIGTSSPQDKLHVYAASTATQTIQDASTALRFAASNGTNFIQSGAALSSDSKAPLVFTSMYGVTEYMRINTSGNVGIGTSSPAYKLDVVGGSISASNAGNNPQLRAVDGTVIAKLQSLSVGYTGGWVGTESNHNFQLVTNNSAKATLDSSGNLGLGATPSAWGSNAKALEIGSGASTSLSFNFSETNLSTNVYRINTGASLYKATGIAMLYTQSSGGHAWSIAPSGTAGDTISFTQAMTLDASGNLGLGTTSPASNGSTFATLSLNGSNGGALHFMNAGTTVMQLYNDANAFFLNAASGKQTIFQTASTERARITSGGYSKFSNDGTYAGSTGSYHEFVNSASDDVIRVRNKASSSPLGIDNSFSAAAPNNTANYFFQCRDTGGERATIRSNGGLANYQGNDVNLSDRREKTNFAPAKSYLDTICAIPVQTFNYIDQSENDPGLTLGVVAQDVQAVAPELVMESDWSAEKDGSKMRLSIYQTDLQYALMKCIQELKAQNDDLRARVAQLEAK
jgi:hypothetical protein